MDRATYQSRRVFAAELTLIDRHLERSGGANAGSRSVTRAAAALRSVQYTRKRCIDHDCYLAAGVARYRNTKHQT